MTLLGRVSERDRTGLLNRVIDALTRARTSGADGGAHPPRTPDATAPPGVSPPAPVPPAPAPPHVDSPAPWPPSPTAPSPTAPGQHRPTGRDRARAWAELLRISALFTVPGDALAGAAALRIRPNRGTALALGASLCLYEAGMALNDWADRDEDAQDRPHRPIPSGRITPPAALTAAATLTAAGLTLAARAGRPALTVATTLAATVWAYDLHLKHTRLGPVAMAATRSLDLLLGATATASRAHPHRTTEPAAPINAAHPRTGTPPHIPGARTHPHHSALRTALPNALILATHTCAVTSVSRHEAHGGSTRTPLAALATTAAIALHATRPHHTPTAPGTGTHGDTAARLLRTALAGTYLHTATTPYLHAALNPSPPLTQRAVGGGIRATIPLQATLAARAGGTTGHATALTLLALVPLARRFARKVSTT